MSTRLSILLANLTTLEIFSDIDIDEHYFLFDSILANELNNLGKLVDGLDENKTFNHCNSWDLLNKYIRFLSDNKEKIEINHFALSKAIENTNDIVNIFIRKFELQMKLNGFINDISKQNEEDARFFHEELKSSYDNWIATQNKDDE